MRKGVLGSIAALTAGAGLAAAQGPRMAAPTAIMPSGLYTNGVSQAGHVEVIPPPVGMMGQPELAGMPMGEPAPNGAPMYPPPGMYGGSPYPAGAAAGPASVLAPHIWLNTEYLLWFVKSQPTRMPFATTSAPVDQGIPGGSTTSVLHSNSDLGYGLFSGFRITGGYYRDEDRRCGFEFGGMLGEHKSNIYHTQSDALGIPVIARPFTDAASGAASVYQVAGLGLASGALTVATSSRVWGLEANIVSNFYRSCPDAACAWSVSGLLGFRFFQLHETLDIDSASTILGTGATFVGQNVSPGGTIFVRDSFETTNRFYGGQIGLKSELHYNRLYLNLNLKLGFGLMNQVVDINGRTTLNDAGQGIDATAIGGVYANSQNIGRFRNDTFAFVPEVGATIGYNCTRWLTSYVGYNGLYTNRVVRPGEVIPTQINSSLLPASNNYGLGGVVPVESRNAVQSQFFVQGVTFGLLMTY